jgi:hypothetical protein
MAVRAEAGRLQRAPVAQDGAFIARDTQRHGRKREDAPEFDCMWAERLFLLFVLIELADRRKEAHSDGAAFGLGAGGDVLGLKRGECWPTDDGPG